MAAFFASPRVNEAAGATTPAATITVNRNKKERVLKESAAKKNRRQTDV